MQHAVLERYHDLVKLAEQRHQLPHTQLIRIRADGAAGDTVITCAVIGLAFKVYLEGGRVLLLLLGRIPRGVLFLFSALPLAVFKSVRLKYHLI